jgi:integrase/recombinase XerD
MSDEIAIAAGSDLVIQEQTADPDHRLVELWLHGRPENTVRAYRRDVAAMCTFVHKPIAEITLADLQAFADSVTGAPATRKRVIGATKSLLSFLARAGLLRFDVGAALRTPKVPDTLAERILTRGDALKLLKRGKNPRDAALLRLLYDAGVRRAEIHGLRVRDVVPADDGGFVTVTGKGSKTRTIRISAETYAQLAALAGDRGPDEPVFVGRDGRALSNSQIWRIVRGAAGRAGIKVSVSPHFLRHSHATHALERRAPIALVRDTLGHSSVAVTDRYLHVRPGESSGKYLGI